MVHLLSQSHWPTIWASRIALLPSENISTPFRRGSAEDEGFAGTSLHDLAGKDRRRENPRERLVFDADDDEARGLKILSTFSPRPLDVRIEVVRVLFDLIPGPAEERFGAVLVRVALLTLTKQDVKLHRLVLRFLSTSTPSERASPMLVPGRCSLGRASSSTPHFTCGSTL